jgi:hypothetical protein
MSGRKVVFSWHLKGGPERKKRKEKKRKGKERKGK